VPVESEKAIPYTMEVWGDSFFCNSLFCQRGPLKIFKGRLKLIDDDHVVRWKQRFDNFRKAISQLMKEFIEKPKLNEFEKQGLIQCFEYTFSLRGKP